MSSPRRWLLVGFVLAIAVPARAPAAPSADADRLRVDWPVEGALTGVALAGLGALELAKNDLVPSRCRWCTAPGIDTTLRDALAWSRTGPARTASDALLLSIPAGFVVYDLLAARASGGVRTSAADVLVVTEAVALTGLLTQGVKYVVARQRPYATGLASSPEAEARVSFWSEHVSLTFAAAAAGGSVAQLRGYAGWPWVYAVGFTAAAATGYFRMAADQHWLTDVLAGAATGTAMGLVIPRLHRGADPDRVSILVVPSGITISGRL